MGPLMFSEHCCEMRWHHSLVFQGLAVNELLSISYRFSRCAPLALTPHGMVRAYCCCAVVLCSSFHLPSSTRSSQDTPFHEACRHQYEGIVVSSAIMTISLSRGHSRVL